MPVRKNRTAPDPFTTTDPETGHTIQTITFGAKQDRAQMFLKDWERLVKLGADRGWSLAHNGWSQRYVRCPDPTGEKTIVTIARLIANAGDKSIVRYKDGDPLNLRGDNLELVDRSTFNRRFVDTAEDETATADSIY